MASGLEGPLLPRGLAAPPLTRPALPSRADTHSLPSSSMSSTSYLQENGGQLLEAASAAHATGWGKCFLALCRHKNEPLAGAHSLVSGMAVTDDLSQDPLLIAIHGFDPRSHLISRLGHIVPRGRNGSTQGWGPACAQNATVSQCHPCTTWPSEPAPALTCHQASRSTGAASWPTAGAGSSARLCAWSSWGAPSHCTGPQSWPLREGREPSWRSST